MPVQDDIVSNENRVAGILKGLVSARSLLTLRLPQYTSTLSTTLLDINSDGIILDELVSGAERMKVGSKFSVYCKNKGIPVIFKSQVEHITTDDESRYYVCSVPDFLKYHQKRRSFRLPTYGHDLQIRLEDSSLEADLLCDVRDVSETGAKLITASGFDLAKGHELLGSIDLGEQELDTRIRVCHIEQKSRRKIDEVGVEFLSLGPREQRRLRDWIFRTERRRLKKF